MLAKTSFILCISTKGRKKNKKYKIIYDNKWETKEIINVAEVICLVSKGWLTMLFMICLYNNRTLSMLLFKKISVI